jgi:2-polyprenyl-3-methyl-5-hydroxy-6-metoxy-1,4-benzoquinol methylase
MKYKAVPDTQGEATALASGEFPLPVVDLMMPLLQTRSLMAGVRLGLFEALRGGARTVTQVAQELSLDAEGVEQLFRVLVCAGYLLRSANKYALTELARKQMLRDGPLSLSGFAKFNYLSWEWIGKLEEVVRTGCGIHVHRSMQDESAWEIYQRAMLESARFDAPLLAPLVPVKPGAARLLDIGGSHGLFGAMICRLYPGLRSEVLDLPQAIEHDRKLAREAGIDDIVTHRAGDALTDELGTDYDVIFLGNIVHHFAPEQNLALLRRAKNALTPRGTIAIWEVEQPGPGAEADIVGDAFALYFRLTSTSRVYTAQEYAGWLSATGYEDVQVSRAPMSPGGVLIAGRSAK